MNKVNYQKEQDKILEKIKGETPKKQLLLHACCAPCASGSIERVLPFFDITLYFYNPNMDSEAEYIKRAEELKKLSNFFNVKNHIENYDNAEFYSIAKGYEKCLEGGERCKRCFYLRLKKTAEFAKEHNYDYFSTTLTLSPLKNAEVINTIGKQVEQESGISFLPCDFKKQGGYLRSIELSKELGLYRQNYCGCVFSKNRP